MEVWLFGPWLEGTWTRDPTPSHSLTFGLVVSISRGPTFGPRDAALQFISMNHFPYNNIKSNRDVLTLYLSGCVTRSAKMFLARSWLAVSPMIYSVTGREECWNNELTVSTNFACSSRLYSAFVKVIITCIGKIFWSADVTSMASLNKHSLPRQTLWKFAPKTVEWLRSDANTNNVHVKHIINIMTIHFRLPKSVPTSNIVYDIWVKVCLCLLFLFTHDRKRKSRRYKVVRWLMTI